MPAADAPARTSAAGKAGGLPSFSELAGLVDPSVGPPGPTLPPGHPFTNVQPANYWSATTLASNPAGAWDVLFNNGDVNLGNKAFSHPVWCVRGGHNDGSEY